MSYQLYWGDLHSHCAISYGHGTVEQALQRAQQQLDFCSVTGHAFWPDMPTDRKRYADIIDYHHKGFATLAGNWNRLLDLQRAGTVAGHFIAFPSYEWHSCEFGDHNVYSAGSNLPLRDAPDLPALRHVVRQANGIAIPHHIGYRAGYRGINWERFREDVSPFVEIFSLHGCSLDENAPYPMLHDMGPRDFGSTAEAGWRLGHRFGIVGGTDHHAAYPGSHGDGRMGVFATACTRDALWEAFLARRVFAATGDRIDARLFVDDAWIGSTIHSKKARRIRIDVRGSDSIDQVELLKNGRILGRFYPKIEVPDPKRSSFRLRFRWGWGRKDLPVEWTIRAEISEGEIRAVETKFSGQAIVAPKSDDATHSALDTIDLPHAVLSQDQRSCSWRSVTTGNLSMRHDTTQGLSLDIEAPLAATLTVAANSERYTYCLGDLLREGRGHFLQGWLSEAIRIGPLVPHGDCLVHAEIDDVPQEACDRYQLQVAQHNGQYAWLTPIWCER